MQKNEYTYLRFVRFKKLIQWDLKRYLNSSIQSKYETVGLKDLINEENKKYDISDKNSQYGILGVNNQTGIFDAYIESGANIKQKYKKMNAGWIAYNPYRINVGSIGIKTNEHKFDYISPAYVVFSCKRSIFPEYLFLTMKTPTFSKIIRDNTTGSVRQNLSYEVLKELSIPLPTIEKQQALVKTYNDKILKAETLEKQAEEIEQEIEVYLLTELGIEQNLDTANNKDRIKKDYKYLKFVKFKDSERWDADFLFGTTSINYIYSSKFNIVHARDFIVNCQYGSSNKADKNSDNIPVLRMNNIQNGEFNTSDLKYLALSKKELSSYRLNKGDLMFNRTNSKELVGKTAVFDMDGDYVFASYLIRVVLDSSKANVYYVNYLFGSKIVRDQIDLISRQILGQANINVDEMKAFLIPLPPLSVQEEIVLHISKIKTQVKSLRQQAEALRTEALEEFEKEVFE